MGLDSGDKITIFCGTAKSTTFKSFIIQYKTSMLPVEKFDACATFIKKNEHFPTCRGAAQLGADQPAETVKTFAHVTPRLVEVIDMGGT